MGTPGPVLNTGGVPGYYPFFSANTIPAINPPRANNAKGINNQGLQTVLSFIAGVVIGRGSNGFLF